MSAPFRPEPEPQSESESEPQSRPQSKSSPQSKSRWRRTSETPMAEPAGSSTSPDLPAPEAPEPPPQRLTFEEVVESGGHRAAPGLNRLGPMALGAQRARRAQGVNASEEVTRTTALWAALALSDEVAAALEPSGITARRLQELLRLADTPEPAMDQSAFLGEELVAAMQRYLAELPAGRVIGVPQVAAAILRSALQSPPAGLLAKRLSSIGADIEGALAGLEPLLRPPPTDRTEWTSDAPAKDDFLGRQYLARALAIRLKRLADPGPGGSSDSYLIHLDGPWGSGKSTLFGFLRTELEGDFLVVPVNAWREQHIGVQWWTLYQALRSAHVAEARFRPWARLKGFWDAASSRAFSVVALLGATLVAALLGVWVAGRSVESLAQFFDSAVKVITFVGLMAGGIAAVRAFLVPDSRRAARGLEESSANPMGDVRRLFARTLRRVGRPVVFLVDDLDRCDEDYVVRFLEVVQTLVRDAAQEDNGAPIRGPYCFVAADGQWLRSSYENHYEHTRITEVPGRPLGYLFLEKVFQLQVRLPTVSPDAKDAFYAAVLSPRRKPVTQPGQQRLVEEATAAAHTATSTAEVHRVTQESNRITDPQQRMSVRGNLAVRLSELVIEEEVENELLPFSRFLEPNPRSMKLFVNSVGIQQSLRALEGVVAPTPTLALWSVVETRWPLLADYLRAHPEDVEDGAADVPDTISALLASEEVKGVLSGSQWGAMTKERILLCTGS